MIDILKSKQFLLSENKVFSNWKIPSQSQLKQEFKVEQELKGNKFWNNEDSFLNSIKNIKIETISSSQDLDIDYRSGTESYEELLDLIKSYKSYPQFRNEDSLKSIYDGFKNNSSMDYPIVIEFKNGDKRVFSGNTRMDIAFQLGINPKVMLVKSDY